jgi:phosphate starvation-inducible PhoH-like protein
MQNQDALLSQNKEKRIPKGPIQFKVHLSEEQKEAKKIILENKLTILSGIAGTSKTFIAVNCALDQFFKREINRITIMRPTVASEDIGHLPGSVDEKMSMWMIPVVENMYLMYGKEKIDKMVKEGDIRMLPLQFTQGITFVNEFVILDEAQNATKEQTLMVLTRLGNGTKMVLKGDGNQVQLKQKNSSGLNHLIEITKEIKDIAQVILTINHRDPLVKEIVEAYGV